MRRLSALLLLGCTSCAPVPVVGIELVDGKPVLSAEELAGLRDCKARGGCFILTKRGLEGVVDMTIEMTLEQVRKQGMTVELDLDDGTVAAIRHAHRGTDDPGLRERHREFSFVVVLVGELAAEDAAGVDVQGAVVDLHRHRLLYGRMVIRKGRLLVDVKVVEYSGPRGQSSGSGCGTGTLFFVSKDAVIDTAASTGIPAITAFWVSSNDARPLTRRTVALNGIRSFSSAQPMTLSTAL